MEVIDRKLNLVMPREHLATSAGNDTLVSITHRSTNNGKSWENVVDAPNYSEGLMKGARRGRVLNYFDNIAGRLLTFINASNVDLGTASEPDKAMSNYFPMYRVSSNLGEYWYCDERIVTVGGTEAKPTTEVTVGKNALYTGDIGSIPIRVGNSILVPMQASVLKSDGKTLHSPGGKGFWFYNSIIFKGTCLPDGKLSWTNSRILGDVKKSVRGFFEPTLAKFDDGILLIVMRGSNGGLTDPRYELPSSKWTSLSYDEGENWTNPVRWAYGNGNSLVSPSSMSVLFRHSNGTTYWVGNVLDSANAQGSLPRSPLVMLEVDQVTKQPIETSLVVLDRANEHETQVDISHVWLREQSDGSVLATYKRNHIRPVKKLEWATLVVSV